MTEVKIVKLEYRTISLSKTETSNETECLTLKYVKKKLKTVIKKNSFLDFL